MIFLALRGKIQVKVLTLVLIVKKMYKVINNLKLYYYGRVSFQNIPNIKVDICLLKIDAVSRRKFENKKNNRLSSTV